jgi:hypothetical protein
LNVTTFLKFEFGDLERSKSAGGDQREDGGRPRGSARRGAPRRFRPCRLRRRQALSAARAPRPLTRQVHRRRLSWRPRGGPHGGPRGGGTREVHALAVGARECHRNRVFSPLDQKFSVGVERADIMSTKQSVEQSTAETLDIDLCLSLIVCEGSQRRRNRVV